MLNSQSGIWRASRKLTYGRNAQVFLLCGGGHVSRRRRIAVLIILHVLALVSFAAQYLQAVEGDCSSSIPCVNVVMIGTIDLPCVIAGLGNITSFYLLYLQHQLRRNDRGENQYFMTKNHTHTSIRSNSLTDFIHISERELGKFLGGGDSICF